jgi:hypothetical protein
MDSTELYYRSCTERPATQNICARPVIHIVPNISGSERVRPIEEGRSAKCAPMTEMIELGFELATSMTITYLHRIVTNVGQFRRGHVVNGGYEKRFAGTERCEPRSDSQSSIWKPSANDRMLCSRSCCHQQL